MRLEIDKSLEDYKNKLELIKLQNQIQYSKLHEIRSSIIAELYGRLIRLNGAMLNLTAGIHLVAEDGEKEAAERITEANDTFIKFKLYYQTNKIYFNNQTCQILDTLVNDYWEAGMDSTEHNRMQSLGVRGTELKESFDKKRAARDKVRNEIPKALSLLKLNSENY